MDMTPPDETGLTLRAPPHSAEAEQSVLGSLLQDNACMALVSECVSEAHFFVRANRLIFGAIAALLKDGKPADIVTVFERLESQNLHEGAGGLAYLSAVESCVPSARNAKLYAEIVADRAAQRALIAGLDEATTVAWDASATMSGRMDRVTGILQQVERQRKATAGSRVPLLRLTALRAASESVRWLVKHIMPADSIGLLFGGSGTFKSFIGLDTGLHVAHGLPWIGRKTAQGSVIYIAAEGGAGLWPRIDAWHRARNLRWQDAPLFVVPAAVDLGADAWRVVDAAQLVGVTPALVIVDTLSQTFSGEENSANEVAAYLRELGARFRALWRCTVLVIHHSGHSATERPRGSSAIRANVDFMFGCHRDEKEMLATLSCVKQKDGQLFDDATFSARVIDLGTDEDGDRVTSLVAHHLSSAYDVGEAMDAESKAGRGGKHQLLLSLLVNGMEVDELRKSFYDDCELTNTEARRQAFFRALNWAKSKGFVEVIQGRCIVTNAKG